MYWVGNIAKSRIIGEILDAHAATPSRSSDYGCGDGGDWKRVLADRPDIRMVGYEPDQGECKRTGNACKGAGGNLHGGCDPDVGLSADCIVTFSVFEHVVDQTRVSRPCEAIAGSDWHALSELRRRPFPDPARFADVSTRGPAFRTMARTFGVWTDRFDGSFTPITSAVSSP